MVRTVGQVFNLLPMAELKPTSLITGWLSVFELTRELSIDDDVSDMFQRCWVVVDEAELTYYDSEEGANKVGSISLEDCSVEIAPESQYQKKFCFNVTSPAQASSLILVAENGTQLQDWMTTIRRVMLKLRRRKKTDNTPKRNFQDEAKGGAASGEGGENGDAGNAGTTEDRLNIYRQWLADAKGDEGSSGGRESGGGRGTDTMRDNLLFEDRRVRKGRIATLQEKCCVVS